KLADAASGIDQAQRSALVLYPDPVDDHVQVRGLTGAWTYSALDEEGRTIMTGRSSGEHGIDASPLADGSYVLCVNPSDGTARQRLKFVKHR
ncbi:MAG TPA: T9SS type A sorting domain-containing protein, partial [Flavobacteriales bacterium]|nr:T9SS type A sorting domain-containing protein [Flavobacteriales bacterium]